MIDFNWVVHQENIAILGMQGSGKTTKAKEILDAIPDVPRLIISPQKPLEHYGSYGEEINKVSDIINGSAQVWTGDFSISTSERIFAILMARCSDMVLVLDDAHEFSSKQRMPPQFSRLVQSGRNRGICGIYLTPSPNLLNNQILQSSQHIFCYKMQMFNQIEWIQKNYFGNDSQVLLPRDRRNPKLQLSEKISEISESFDVLPKYSYLYRAFYDSENQLILGDESG